MAQNRSHAVMAQRAEPHDSFDFFPTPPWATRALTQQLYRRGLFFPKSTVWEPACGQGHMARPLSEFCITHASDVHDYGFGEVDDFLLDFPRRKAFDWIITNPPFRLAEQFVQTARHRALHGVAILVRTAFLEGVQRHAELFSQHPPTLILQFVERVPMVKGRVSKEATTATSYCWIVWFRGQGTITAFDWIPPCRKRLERAGDYD